VEGTLLIDHLLYFDCCLITVFQSLRAISHPGLSTPYLMWMPGLEAPLILCVLLKASHLPATGLSDQSCNMLAVCMVLSLPVTDIAHRQLQGDITSLLHGILHVLYKKICW